MSVEDVARALMAMDDRELRVRVAAGDLSGLGAVELSEHEQELLVAAASAVPGDDEVEVAGFGMVSFAPPYVPVGVAMGGIPLRNAMQYAQDGIADPTLAASFHEWSVNVTAQGDW